MVQNAVVDGASHLRTHGNGLVELNGLGLAVLSKRLRLRLALFTGLIVPISASMVVFSVTQAAWCSCRLVAIDWLSKHWHRVYFSLTWRRGSKIRLMQRHGLASAGLDRRT